eukprot:PhF_6_TR40539/c0_g1_i1/m.60738
MSSRAALFVVCSPYAWTPMEPIVSSLIPNTFNRIVVSEHATTFDKEITTTTDPVVFLIGNGEVNQVLHTFSTRCPGRIQWVHSIFAGMDAFQLHKIADDLKDIPISNAQGVYSSMLAEHGLLSCMYFARQLWRLQQNRKNKVWDRYVNLELRGATMGIVGYGNIGKATAKLALTFGMNVIGYKRTLPEGSGQGSTDEMGVMLYTGDEGLRHVLSSSDYVVSLLPFTPDTSKLMNFECFQQMKRSAVFINMGRGQTVDEDAIYKALTEGVIKGAALDVFDVEPLPSDSPLWSLPDDKFLMTCHNADIGEDSFTSAGKQFEDYARTWASKGELPKYLVDVKRG